MATELDPLEYLERSDKWYLGGGKGAVYAPAFPRFLSSVGFWDEAYFADVRLDRLYTVLILDEDGRPIRLTQDGTRWTPDALTQTHRSSCGLRLRDDRLVSTRDLFSTRLTVLNESRRDRTLHVILWTAQDRNLTNGRFASDAQYVGGFWQYALQLDYADDPYADRPADNGGWGEQGEHTPQQHKLYVALGADRAPASHCMEIAQRADGSPRWEVSPVPEVFHGGQLHGYQQAAFVPQTAPNAAAEEDAPSELHLCLHYPLTAAAGESASIQFAAAVGLDRRRTLHHLQNDLQQNITAVARASWRKWFADTPYFDCSDPYLMRTWWYRWYGLRLNRVDIGDDERTADPARSPRFPFPCVFEGIGGFRSHISYSAQAHMREAAWMHDPSLAMGVLEGMLANQENSGYIPGHIYLWRNHRGFYHTDWGQAALQTAHISGDIGFVSRIYPGLSRYADYFERVRDHEDMHLYDIHDQGETGQEYMSRYLFADTHADDWRRIQLKGVDSSVYVYRLQRSLAEMADMLGKQPEAAVWSRKADMTREAVRSKLWDPELAFFVDLDPRTGRRSSCIAAVGFYPFLCDIATEEHLSAITARLLNPEEFWTPFPVPASSLKDPYFDAEARWRGRRMSCPWNGRSWPMATSHVCDALANAARTLSPGLRERAAELVSAFVRTLFFDGDPSRPNCFEHYNPFTGTASMYRGIDDYMHSWVNDLIVRHVVGIQPGRSDTLVIDPLPFDIDRFEMRHVRYRGHTITVQWTAGRFAVIIDSVVRHESSERERVEIPL
jgi:hypothetical protein